MGGSADVAGKVEIHEMAMSGGVMKMRPLDNGLEIPLEEPSSWRPVATV
jgi:copper(I)-binding protein